MTLPAGSWPEVQTVPAREVLDVPALAVVKPSPPRFSKASLSRHSSCDDVSPALIRLTKEIICSVKKQPPIKSLIAVGTCIEGNITTDGLRIDGGVWATSASDNGSILVVKRSAMVSGHIVPPHHQHARAGVCAELLELQPKARVEGDVSYKALEMHPQGATIIGQYVPTTLQEIGTNPLSLQHDGSQRLTPVNPPRGMVDHLLYFLLRAMRPLNEFP
jgi:cytoskeletal protein CcmA (bactofilin family)